MYMIAGLVFIPFLCAAIAAGMAKKQDRLLEVFAIAVSAVEFALALAGALHVTTWEVFAFSLPLTFTEGGFHGWMSVLAAFLWLMTSIFSVAYFAHEREHLGRYWFFVLASLGATQGVMLSADFMTAFIFFEIVSFTSFVWVIHEETKEAVRAGFTYLFIAVFGGMILFMGLALLYHETGTLRFDLLPAAIAVSPNKTKLFAAGVCILFGFGAKAGMFPLHMWLPMAHPVAPSPASALLSGILTKVGVYGILMNAIYVMRSEESFGYLVLTLGLITMVLGALKAILSKNLKRTLACSSMSQIGFILTGVAMFVVFSAKGHEEGAHAALCGTMLHITNHALIKLTLFCASGVVLRSAETLLLEKLRGWGRKKNLIKAVFAFGALGISGLPLFNGYLSKTLLHEAIAEAAHLQSGNLALFLHVAEWIFLISSGLTFAYMLKLFFTIFVEKNEEEKVQEKYDEDKVGMQPIAACMLSVSALLMPLLGQPPLSCSIAKYASGQSLEFGYTKAFSPEAIKGGFICLCIGAAVYLLAVRRNSPLQKLLKTGAKKEGTAAKSSGLAIGSALLGAVKAILSIIDYGMDAPIDLCKMFLSKEQDKKERHTPVYGLIQSALTGSRYETHTITGSFSFALMMTCFGILIILFVLLIKLF